MPSPASAASHGKRVRTTAKVRCVLLLHALAHNLMRTFTLAPQLLGYGKGASSEPAMAR